MHSEQSNNEHHSLPAQPSSLLNLDGLIQLAGDDEEFRSELINSNITAFQDFLPEYEQHLLLAPDLTKLKFLNHRIKVVIKLINADLLAKELEIGEGIFQNGYTNDKAADSVKRVTAMVEQINRELQKHCTV